MMEKGEVQVVLVEDSKDFSTAVERYLEDDQNNRYHVTKYEDANTALLALKAVQEVHLFIVDLKLPHETSGYDFLRIVQEEGLFPEAPRMVISDLSKDSMSLSGRTLTMDNLREVGVADYVEKRALWRQAGGEEFLQRVNALIETPSTAFSPLMSNLESQLFVFQSGVYIATVGGALSVFASLLTRPAFLNGSLGLLALGATMIGLAATNGTKART